MRVSRVIFFLLSMTPAVGCQPISAKGSSTLFPDCPAGQKGFYVGSVDDRGICGFSRSACGVDKNAAIVAARPFLTGALYACDASIVNPATLCAPGSPVGPLPNGCSQ